MINDGNNWGGGYTPIQIQGHQTIVEENHRTNKKECTAQLSWHITIEKYSPNRFVIEGADGRHRQ